MMKPEIGDIIKLKYSDELMTIRHININEDNDFTAYTVEDRLSDSFRVYHHFEVELVFRETLKIVCDYRKDGKQ